MRAGAEDNEVVVRTEIKGQGEPIQLDYRLEKTGDGLEDLRRQRHRRLAGRALQQAVSPEIGAGGIDGLIAKLAERNKAAGKS